MKQLKEIKNIIDAQRDEIASLKDRLILAQSEALSAIQQNEPKPEPCSEPIGTRVSENTLEVGDIVMNTFSNTFHTISKIVRNVGVDHYFVDNDPKPLTYWAFRLIHRPFTQQSAPEPRDIGHENVVSFVTRKSGELQVSPGIVWGLIMDLIAKNPNHFGTDADACPDPCPDPVGNVNYCEPFGFRVGDVVRTNKFPEYLSKIIKIDQVTEDAAVYYCSISNNERPHPFNSFEIEFVSRP